MTRIALKVEECCAWCRQPVERCSAASCDDAHTYNGALLRGEWREVQLENEGSHKAPSVS
jgi:hypothetical protein